MWMAWRSRLVRSRRTRPSRLVGACSSTSAADLVAAAVLSTRPQPRPPRPAGASEDQARSNPPGDLAIASINLDEDRFGAAFGIERALCCPTSVVTMATSLILVMKWLRRRPRRILRRGLGHRGVVAVVGCWLSISAMAVRARVCVDEGFALGEGRRGGRGWQGC